MLSGMKESALYEQVKTSLSLKKLFLGSNCLLETLPGKRNVEGIMRMRNLLKWKLLHGEGMVCRNKRQKENMEVIHFKLNSIPHKRRLVKVRKKIQEVDCTLHIGLLYCIFFYNSSPRGKVRCTLCPPLCKYFSM